MMGRGRNGQRRRVSTFKAKGPLAYGLAVDWPWTEGMAVERGRAGDVVKGGGYGRRLVGVDGRENDGLDELERLGRGLGRWHWACGRMGLGVGECRPNALELGHGDT